VIYSNVDIDRFKYDSFVENSPQGSLFSKSWWLDMWMDDWRCAIINNSAGEIQCAMAVPVLCNRIGELNVLNPPLTRYLGVMFRASSGRAIKVYSEQTKFTEKLVEDFDKYSFYSIFFHYRYDYWIPLRERGFSQETFYTYILNTQISYEEIFSGYRENVRREIRKAEKTNDIKRIGIEEFAPIYFDTFKCQGIPPPISKEKLFEIDPLIDKNTGRYIFGAYKDGVLTAAIYVVEDKAEIRYLMGGKNQKYRSTGAPSLLIDHAIKMAKQKNKKFNFEGSMKIEIARFFRSFGGELTPYYRLSKDNRIMKKFRKEMVF
jgi:hypothetical protein